MYELLNLENDINKNNELKNLIKSMPKGSVLHSHFVSAVDWHLYFNRILKDDIKNIYKVYIQIVENTELPKGYKSMLGDFSVFPVDYKVDEKEYTELTIENYKFYAHQLSDYNDWGKLRNSQRIVWRLIRHYGYYQLFFHELLKGSVNDNVQHVELKTTLGNLYRVQYDNTTLSASVLSAIDEIQLLIDVYNTFEDKDKITYALIPGCSRRVKPNDAMKKFKEIALMHKKFPNVIRGVDLFGVEHTGYLNCSYNKVLKYILNETINDEDFVIALHSGERTNKEPESILGENEVDCLISNYDTNNNFDKNIEFILNLQKKSNKKFRIGHGISLIMFPKLLEVVKELKNVHIEICPISNKILGYFTNIKDNPGFEYYKQGISISISPDDMSFYGSDGVSSDWYEVITQWNLSLEDIKKICMNSINFSAVNSKSREEIISRFNPLFDEFEIRFNEFMNNNSSVENIGGSYKKHIRKTQNKHIRKYTRKYTRKHTRKYTRKHIRKHIRKHTRQFR